MAPVNLISLTGVFLAAMFVTQALYGQIEPTQRFNGSQPLALAGVVSDTGDLNGDGFDDFAVGAPTDDPNVVLSVTQARGMVRVYSGLDGSIIHTFVGTSMGDRFGYSVANAGDVDGDGTPDLIVGAIGHGTQMNTGMVQVFSGLTGAVIHTLLGAAQFDFYGFSVDGVGDIDADGFDDFVVGIPGSNLSGFNNGGCAQIYSGSSASLLSTLLADSADDSFGYDVSAAGDVDNDGTPDVLVGIPFDDMNGADSGTATVFSGATWTSLYSFNGMHAGAYLGWSVSDYADINNDGFFDFIVGAPEATVASNVRAGRADVHSGIDGSFLHRIKGDKAEQKVGYDVSCAGDVNADGTSDFIVGRQSTSAVSEIKVHSGVGVFDVLTLIPPPVAPNNTSNFGNYVRGVGDTNGDGFDDVLVGDIAGLTALTSVEGAAYLYQSPPSFFGDIEMTEVRSPLDTGPSCFPRSTMELVEVQLKNNGFTIIPAGSTITMTYQLGALPLVTEVLVVAAPIMPQATTLYAFATPLDLSAFALHNIVITASFAPDTVASNNSLTTVVNSGPQQTVTSFPWTEDFTLVGANGSSILPAGFLNDQDDNPFGQVDWLMRDDIVPPIMNGTQGTISLLGPSADHTTGISGVGGFAYASDNNFPSNVAMISPCLDLTGLMSPRASFYYHAKKVDQFSSGTNQLSVSVLDPASGVLTSGVAVYSFDTGDTWARQVVDLAPFTGSVIQLIFRADMSSTIGLNQNLAIDDLSVFDFVPPLGQQATPSQAVLDINRSRNVNGALVQDFVQGPFFATVSNGGVLDFAMTGEPLMPIILFVGPLNAQAATFPGIGSVDAGGPLNPTTGIPTLLTELVNGNLPGLFNSIFVTSSSGFTSFGALVPNFPNGPLGTFQCLFQTQLSPGLKLSNAVQVTIQ